MDLSVVIPVYNEEESVKPLYRALKTALDKLNYEYEIVLVDDGSKDNTFANASELAKNDPTLKVVRLKRNHGQTIGLHAGFQSAAGKMIVTMDGDLQNDPEDIGLMLEKIKEGNHIVLGWRHNRKDKIISRKIPSKIANWLVRKTTGVPVKDNGCAIRAYKSEVINKFPMYSEMHRLLPVITALAGAKFTQVKVRHHERKFGHSKYGLSRIYKVLLDLTSLKAIFSWFNKPLFGFGYYSLATGFLASLFFIYALYSAFAYPGESIIISLSISLLLGSLAMFLFFLGVVAHLIYKTGNYKIENLYSSRGIAQKRINIEVKRS